MNFWTSVQNLWKAIKRTPWRMRRGRIGPRSFNPSKVIVQIDGRKVETVVSVESGGDSFTDFSESDKLVAQAIATEEPPQLTFQNIPITVHFTSPDKALAPGADELRDSIAAELSKAWGIEAAVKQGTVANAVVKSFADVQAQMIAQMHKHSSRGSSLGAMQIMPGYYGGSQDGLIDKLNRLTKGYIDHVEVTQSVSELAVQVVLRANRPEGYDWATRHLDDLRREAISMMPAGIEVGVSVTTELPYILDEAIAELAPPDEGLALQRRIAAKMKAKWGDES
jgi:hypothetical protein